PVIATVALTRLRLSGSVTDTLGDNVTNACSSVKDALAATFDKVGGSLTLVTLTVEVTGVLTSTPPFAVPLGSIKVEVAVPAGSEPKLVGFSPALKVTESRTDW